MGISLSFVIGWRFDDRQVVPLLSAKQNLPQPVWRRLGRGAVASPREACWKEGFSAPQSDAEISRCRSLQTPGR